MNEQRYDINGPIDSISIIYNDVGICDFAVFQGKDKISLTEEPFDCDPLIGARKKVLTITPEKPLVGFQGLVDNNGIEQLGLILLDTISEDCQHSPKDANVNWAGNEGGIVIQSEEERERAKTFEAILRYDLIRKAKE